MKDNLIIQRNIALRAISEVSEKWLLSSKKLYKLAKLYRENLEGQKMNETEIYEQIKKALVDAPRNQYTMEIHLQMIKYADQLKNVTSKEFCEGVGLKLSYGTEFSKMRNLTQRLKAAGLKAALL